MNSSTRRGFLALSATGVATGVAAVAAPAAMAADAPSEATASNRSGPIVAYVSDARRGEVSVMHGEHEVVVHDPALVRLITKHA